MLHVIDVQCSDCMWLMCGVVFACDGCWAELDWSNKALACNGGTFLPVDGVWLRAREDFKTVVCLSVGRSVDNKYVWESPQEGFLIHMGILLFLP